MLFQVPASYLAYLSISGAILYFFSLHKVTKMVRSSIVRMYMIGAFLLGPALVVFGIVYFHFSSNDVEILVRMFVVRLTLFYLLLMFNFWKVVILIFGKNL